MEQAGGKPHPRGTRHFVTYGRSADCNDCFRPVRPKRVAVPWQFRTPPQSGTRQSAISWRHVLGTAVRGRNALLRFRL